MVLKFVSIALKIAQFVVLLAATGVVGYFLNQSRSFLDDNNKKDAYDGGSLGRFEMFLNATAIGAIIAIIGLVALLTNLHERFGGLAMVAVIALWTVQLLVASALLAKVLATLEKEKEIPFLVHDRKTTCEQWDDKDYKFKCTHIIGGVICGFLGTLLFAVDTIVSVILSQQSSPPGAQRF